MWIVSFSYIFSYFKDFFSVLTLTRLRKSPLRSLWLNKKNISWGASAQFLKKTTVPSFDLNRNFKLYVFTFSVIRSLVFQFWILWNEQYKFQGRVPGNIQYQVSQQTFNIREMVILGRGGGGGFPPGGRKNFKKVRE